MPTLVMLRSSLRTLGLSLALASAVAAPAGSIAERNRNEAHWLRLAVERLCPQPGLSGLDAQTALPGSWLLDETRRPEDGVPRRITIRLLLPGADELTVERRQFGGRLRQFLVSYAAHDGEGAQPSVQAIADGGCAIRSGRAIRTEDGGWAEHRVWCDGADLVLVETPVRSEVLAWLEAHAADVPAGGVVECQLAASNWMGRMIDPLEAGAIVVIDYGDTSEGLLPRRRRGGTLRTYRSHHLSRHPLDEPGSMDITADVDFSALARVASDRGTLIRLCRQDEFLSGLGLDARRAELRQRELAEARGGDPIERLRLRSRVKEIDTLLHPRGFGDFRVLVATR